MNTQTKKKRIYHCSICGIEGHIKNSCPNNIDYLDSNIMNKELDTKVIDELTIDDDITILKSNHSDKKQRIMNKILEGIQNDISATNVDVWIRNKDCLSFHISVIKEAQINGINGDFMKIYLDIITDMDEINI